MGVAGSGKTSLGQLLAKDLGWEFLDADSFHSPANLDKMRRGLPLDDADRRAWLERLSELVMGRVRKQESAILACSALKQAYREQLSGGRGEVKFVYLKGDYELIRQRLADRGGHFFGPELLQSQFETLEEPIGVPIVDAAQDPQSAVLSIRKALDL